MSSRERYSIKSFTNPSGTEVFRVIGRTPEGTQIRRNFQDMREAIGFKAELEIAEEETEGEDVIEDTEDLPEDDNDVTEVIENVDEEER